MKERRHKTILTIIDAQGLHSQADIVERLRKKGFDVTQASVSRDLEELGIRKINGVYSSGPQNGFATAFGAISFETSGANLIVAKCGSGLASALAVHLDALQMREIAGTIAGDDTIFIALSDESAQSPVLRSLKERFGG